MKRVKSMLHNGVYRRLATGIDVGDVRDYFYEPTLSALASHIDPRQGDCSWWSNGRVRDQGDKPNCTAQALAGIIDHLRVRNRVIDLADGDNQLRREDRVPWASAGMLYKIAKFHDSFPGEDYEGSSIRGALKAFYFNGACADELTRDMADKQWHMTREILESARKVQLGAYYRVRPRLPDVHAALNETGLVLASADLHHGWQTGAGTIAYRNGREEPMGRHAFILVGYTEDGFLVQNSWGRSWGDDGVALWSYEDWSANIVDMWVLRLAVPVNNRPRVENTQIARSRVARLGAGAFDQDALNPATPPSRFDVLGHVASTSRGKLDRHGPYHVDMETLQETVNILEQSDSYKHVLIHFMGLQRHENATMAAIRDAVPIFKKNGIYPFFVTVENELANAVHDMIETEVDRANTIAGAAVSREKDRLIEGRISGAPLRIMEEIQRSSMRVMYENGTDRAGEGLDLLNAMFVALEGRYRRRDFSYHMSAHGFGTSLLVALLSNFEHWSRYPVLSSVHLFSPLLPAGIVRDVFVERLVHRGDRPVSRRARGEDVALEKLCLYLQKESARDKDRPFPGYDGNWPALWSRVLSIAEARNDRLSEEILSAESITVEEKEGYWSPLVALGHELKALGAAAGLEVLEQDALHKDFDLTTDVLDDLLVQILGREPEHRFKTAYPGRKRLRLD